MRFLRFAIRDAAILGLTALAWRRDRSAGPSLAGALAGGLTALSGFLAHEWGHLAGTVLSGGFAHEPDNLASPFLFFFDTTRSDRRSFLWMSYGGYAATVAASAAIVCFAPADRWSGKVARGATVLGAPATLALEIPTTVRVARGGDFPTGFVYR